MKAAWAFITEYSQYIIAIVIVGIVIACANILVSNGKQIGISETMVAWQAEELKRKNEIDTYKTLIADTVKEHAKETERNKNEIASIKLKAKNDLANLQHDYDQRLLVSSKRGEVYKRLSESGTAERSRLVQHAADLDRSVEEGRLVVREHQSAIRERDEIIATLLNQIRSLQTLTNSVGTQNDRPD